MPDSLCDVGSLVLVGVRVWSHESSWFNRMLHNGDCTIRVVWKNLLKGGLFRTGAFRAPCTTPLRSSVA